MAVGQPEQAGADPGQVDGQIGQAGVVSRCPRIADLADPLVYLPDDDVADGTPESPVGLREGGVPQAGEKAGGVVDRQDL